MVFAMTNLAVCVETYHASVGHENLVWQHNVQKSLGLPTA